jgi:alpha-tubulin suppressor-like RCC1 family protein
MRPRHVVPLAAATLLFGACGFVGSAGVAPIPDEAEAPREAPPPVAPQRVEVAQQVRYDDAVYVDDLVAAGAHACARSHDGRLFCWGSNRDGQLGGAAGEFTQRPVRVGRDVQIERVFAGPTQTAVVRRDGEVGHWGRYAPRLDDQVTPWARHDTPGLGAVTGATFGEHNALAWDHNGRLVAWGVPDAVSFTTAFLVKPVLVYLSFRVEQAAVWSRESKGHGCLVAQGGVVACWGDNEQGQLGRAAFEQGIFIYPALGTATRVAVGEQFSCALGADRAVWCWGANDVGQLGDTTKQRRDLPERVRLPGEAVAFAAGARHACAILRDGSTWCWGVNDRGQVGASVEISATTPVRVVGVPKAVGVACGDDFSCVRTEQGEARCWGRNDRGQLGDGTLVGGHTQRRVLL